MARPKRKCAKPDPTNKPPTKMKASHYLGYVHDNEPLDFIMKKFEALEEFKTQNKLRSELTEDQVEAMMKLTTSFSLEAAIMEEEHFNLSNDSQSSDSDVEEKEEEEWSEDEFWDSAQENETEDTPKKKERKKKAPVDKDSAATASRKSRPRQVNVDGFMYTVKKKQKVIDPTQPEYVRIPPLPIPRPWAKKIRPYSDPVVAEGSKYLEADIFDLDLTKLGGEFTAILMDPPWELPRSSVPGRTSPAQLSTLKITEDLIPVGFIFCWIEKELIPQAVEVMRKWKFIYVENFAWVKKSVNNRFVVDDYDFFRKSKLSLLIFRKDTNAPLELRHQRNPDVEFAFRQPHGNVLDDPKPDSAFELIETLLPTALYDPNAGRGKLLHLWAPKGATRKGWTSVHHTPKVK